METKTVNQRPVQSNASLRKAQQALFAEQSKAGKMARLIEESNEHGQCTIYRIMVRDLRGQKVTVALAHECNLSATLAEVSAELGPVVDMVREVVYFA
jgi:hypothetical protein